MPINATQSASATAAQPRVESDNKVQQVQKKPPQIAAPPAPPQESVSSAASSTRQSQADQGQQMMADLTNQMAGVDRSQPLSPQTKKELEVKAGKLDAWSIANQARSAVNAITATTQDTFEKAGVGSGTTAGRAVTGARTGAKWTSAVGKLEKALKTQNDPDATAGQKLQGWAAASAATATAISWTNKAIFKDPYVAGKVQDKLGQDKGHVATDDIEMKNMHRRPSSTSDAASESPTTTSPLSSNDSLSGPIAKGEPLPGTSSAGTPEATSHRPVNPDKQPSGVSIGTTSTTASYRPIDYKRQSSGVSVGTATEENPVDPRASTSPPADNRSADISDSKSQFLNKQREDDFRHQQYGSHKHGLDPDWEKKYTSVMKGMDNLGRVGNAGTGILGVHDGMTTLADSHAPILDKVNGGLGALSAVGDVAEAGAGLLGSAGVSGASAAATAIGAITGAYAAPLAFIGITAAIKGESKSQTTNSLNYDMAYDQQMTDRSNQTLTNRVDSIESALDAMPEKDRPRNVILNNNNADLYQSMSGPYNTASGQFNKQDRDNNGGALLVKTSDIVINGGGSKTGGLNYDGNQPASSSEASLPYPDTMKEDQKGKYASQFSYAQQYADQGYTPAGTGEFERVYQERNWDASFDGGLQRRYPSNDPHAAITTYSAGSAYMQKTVNPSGNWDYMQVNDQPVQKKDTPFDQTFPGVASRNHYQRPTLANADYEYGYANGAEKVDRDNKVWDQAYPTLPPGRPPVLRDPQPFHRMISTNSSQRTEVELGNIQHPVTLNLKNADDRITLSRMPESPVTINLPPSGGRVNLKNITSSASLDLGKSSSNSFVYRFTNGQELTISGNDQRQLKSSLG